jgi:tetratricopeptide (TPR) repeat protein
VSVHESVAALTNLAGCLCELGQLDEAMDACQRGLSLDPNHAPALTNLGNILDAQGRFEDAVIAYRRAVTADPPTPKDMPISPSGCASRARWMRRSQRRTAP